MANDLRKLVIDRQCGRITYYQKVLGHEIHDLQGLGMQDQRLQKLVE